MEQSSMLVIIDDPRFDLHETTGILPETPVRTSSIRHSLLNEFGPNGTTPIIWYNPQPVSREILENVHSKQYVSSLLNKCGKATAKNLIIDGDSELPITPGTGWAILHAAGTGIQAADLIFDSESQIQRVFCNVRPPGHHAFKGKGMRMYNQGAASIRQ